MAEELKENLQYNTSFYDKTTLERFIKGNKALLTEYQYDVFENICKEKKFWNLYNKDIHKILRISGGRLLSFCLRGYEKWAKLYRNAIIFYFSFNYKEFFTTVRSGRTLYIYDMVTEKEIYTPIIKLHNVTSEYNQYIKNNLEYEKEFYAGTERLYDMIYTYEKYKKNPNLIIDLKDYTTCISLSGYLLCYYYREKNGVLNREYDINKGLCSNDYIKKILSLTSLISGASFEDTFSYMLKYPINEKELSEYNYNTRFSFNHKAQKKYLNEESHIVNNYSSYLERLTTEVVKEQIFMLKYVRDNLKPGTFTMIPISPKIEDYPTKIENDPTKIENDPTKIEDNPTKIENDPTKIEDNPTKIEDYPTKIEDNPINFVGYLLHKDNEKLIKGSISYINKLEVTDRYKNILFPPFYNTVDIANLFKYHPNHKIVHIYSLFDTLMHWDYRLYPEKNKLNWFFSVGNINYTAKKVDDYNSRNTIECCRQYNLHELYDLKKKEMYSYNSIIEYDIKNGVFDYIEPKSTLLIIDKMDRIECKYFINALNGIENKILPLEINKESLNLLNSTMSLQALALAHNESFRKFVVNRPENIKSAELKKYINFISNIDKNFNMAAKYREVSDVPDKNIYEIDELFIFYAFLNINDLINHIDIKTKKILSYAYTYASDIILCYITEPIHHVKETLVINDKKYAIESIITNDKGICLFYYNNNAISKINYITSKDIISYNNKKKIKNKMAIISIYSYHIDI